MDSLDEKGVLLDDVDFRYPLGNLFGKEWYELDESQRKRFVSLYDKGMTLDDLIEYKHLLEF